MKKKLPGLLLITISLSATVFAQETTPLKLDEAIESALRKNKGIEISELEKESAQARYRQTNAVFLPNVSASYSAMSTTNPLNAFGFKLQQESVTPADFNPEILNDPAATKNFMTKVSWQQPLINMDMLFMRRAAGEEVALYEAKKRYTKEFTSYEVQKGYAQLQLAYEAKNVLEGALHTAREIYRASEQRFEKGLLQKADLLQVLVQVKTLETQLSEAGSNVQNASDYLSLLMGTTQGVVYIVDTITIIPPTETLEASVPVHRADLQAMQYALSAQNNLVKSGRMTFLPRLNAFADYYINDPEAFGFNSTSYLAGVQLSWTIFNGLATRNKISEYKINREKVTVQLASHREQSQLDLNKTIRQLDDSRFAISQQETGVSQASEALRIQKNRYQQGLVSTNDILQTQSLLAKQQLQLAQALYQYKTTYAYYQLITSTTENK